jgi:phage tail-like protein
VADGGNGSGSGGTRRVDPPFTGRFVFRVEGVGEIGAFTEVSGLSVDVEVEELKEGGENHFVHKLPGRTRWPNLVLKRGITDSNALFEWFGLTSGMGFAGHQSKLDRREGAVVLLDSQGQPLRTWEFKGAFPVKWTGPTLAASSRDVAVEQLEIAHHGFTAS